MSKAREYYSDVFIDVDMPDDTVGDFAVTMIDMNHKTLEDVKELIEDIETIQSEGVHLWVHKTRLLEKLEKLKL